jgi:hypothetical protein
MYVQAVRHMDAEYAISSSTVTSIKAVVGVEKGDYEAAGEIAIENTSTFQSVQSLHATKKRHQRARLVRPELAISSQYTCYSYNPYSGGYLGTGKCVTESSGKWTGVVHSSKETFHGCHFDGSNVTEFSNRTQKSLATGAGVSYASSVSAGALGSSLTISAAYGSGTEVRLNFDQGGKKHKFCVGGDSQYVSESAKLYVNSLNPHKQDGPCGKGSTRCRQAS